jgi:ribosome biogenesis GTPase
MERGRVLSISPQGIAVEIDGSIVTCMLRGVMKKEKTQAKNLVTVGDFVFVERNNAGEGVIGHIEARRTVLSRAENLSRRKEQLIAANIDQVIITVSVVAPALKSPLVDRYIIATQKGNMEPIVVVNKLDLLKDENVDSVLRQQQEELYQEFIKAYEAAGIPVIGISAVTGDGLEVLKKAMACKASVFSGQSGVGKSSLINAVTGTDLRVGKLVDRTNKGTHTTTTAQLLPLSFGGWCIDTPGIKSFGVWDLDKEEIAHYFTEIFEKGLQCRFPNCSHMTEEGCAVVAAVNAGEISVLRYDSYLGLMVSLSETHSRR